jgi:hypothetical protein
VGSAPRIRETRKEEQDMKQSWKEHSASLEATVAVEASRARAKVVEKVLPFVPYGGP